MNIAQRLVLVGGAVAALSVPALIPRVQIYQGTVLRLPAPAEHPTDAVARSYQTALARVIDVRTVAAYLVGICAATILLYLAVASSPAPSVRRMAELDEEIGRLWREIADIQDHLTAPPPR